MSDQLKGVFLNFFFITFFNKLQTLAKQPEMVPLLPLAWFERFVANLAVVIIIFICVKTPGTLY